MTHTSRRRLGLAAIAVLSVAAVGAALFTQYAWDLQPCPWCVLQRAIFCALALVALLGALLPALLQPLFLLLSLVGAGLGLAAATWQHFVAAEQASCAMTLADRLIGDLGLDARWPEVFMATAACADKPQLIGLPYEYWSGALFALLLLAALWLLLRGKPRERNRFRR
ncbi:MAG: hypothetical protein AMXMBFR78_27710 [Rubrivivax sp.]